MIDAAGADNYHFIKNRNYLCSLIFAMWLLFFRRSLWQKKTSLVIRR